MNQSPRRGEFASKRSSASSIGEIAVASPARETSQTTDTGCHVKTFHILVLGMVIFVTSVGFLHYTGTANLEDGSISERLSNEYDNLSQGASTFGQRFKTFWLGSVGEGMASPEEKVKAYLRDFIKQKADLFLSSLLTCTLLCV
jgi:hypothetical protein